MNRMKLLVALTFFILSPVIAWSQPINVNITWGFSPNNSITNYTRHIIHQANLDQNKYNFYLDVKPGAAGLIAAKQVLQDTDNKKISILMTTDAFFVRPFLYKNPGYNFNEFDLMYQLAQVPMALVVKKNQKFDTLVNQPSVSLSTVGPGSLTHVMAEQFKKVTPGQTILVGYAGTREAIRDVIGGNLDLAFDFVGSVVGDPNLDLVGITGNQSYPGIKKLSDLNQKYQPFENLNLGVYYLVSSKLNTNTASEIKNILLQAQIKNHAFQNSLATDYSKPGATSTKFYQERIKQIEKLTFGMEKLD